MFAEYSCRLLHLQYVLKDLLHHLLGIAYLQPAGGAPLTISVSEKDIQTQLVLAQF